MDSKRHERVRTTVRILPAHERRTVVLGGPGQFAWVGVRTMMQQHFGFTVVAHVSESDQLLLAAQRRQPHVIVLAVDLAGDPVHSVVAQLRCLAPESHIMAIGDGIDSHLGLQLKRSGAHAILAWEDVTPDLMVCALIAVEQNLHVASPSIVQAVTESREIREQPPALSHLERDVLVALAGGQTEREIAAELGVGFRTTQQAVHTLKDKLRAPTRMALGVRAEKLGLL